MHNKQHQTSSFAPPIALHRPMLFLLLLGALFTHTPAASGSTFSDQCLLVYPKANPSTFSSSSASQDKNITQVEEPTDWNHGTSTAVTKKDLNKPNTKRITFHIPPTTQVGDTLFLFLHRTEAVTPLNIDKWTRATECLKQYNEQKECFTFEDCIKQEGAYCSKFNPKLDGSNKGSGLGNDLNVGVYYRHVTEEDPTCWTIELPSWRANWITVTAIPDVNKEQPIASSMGTSCDGNPHSVFPSLSGNENDILLLSMSGDDAYDKARFQAPLGTETLGHVKDEDETAFLYGKRFDSAGTTGNLSTTGSGATGGSCKDIALSIVVNRQPPPAPSLHPSSSSQPSTHPSSGSSQPSSEPSFLPTSTISSPTQQPTTDSLPSHTRSSSAEYPSSQPSSKLSPRPSFEPSFSPPPTISSPTQQPTTDSPPSHTRSSSAEYPSSQPSSKLSPRPSSEPSFFPTISSPTPLPTTASPTPLPTTATPTPVPTTATPTPLPTTASPTPEPLKIMGCGNNGDWKTDKDGCAYPLLECTGDCDNDNDCAGDLVCHQRDEYEPVPGCSGGEQGASKTDYCVRPTGL